MRKLSKVEAVLWGIALPGFGQLLNGQWVKGITLIVLEFAINCRTNLNLLIIHSFHGRIKDTIQETDYQWIMFYPCVYMFGIWDAYREAGGGEGRYAVLPFAFAAFIGTVGIIFSQEFLGAVWLGTLGALAGIGIGLGLRRGLERAAATAKD